MIDEKYMDEIMADLEARMSALDYAIIQKLAKRLRDTIENMGEAQLITSSLKNILQLEASGMLYQDIEKICERMMPDIVQDVRQAFTDAIPKLNDFEYFEPKERKLAEEAENIAQSAEKPLESANTSAQMDDRMKEQIDFAYQRTKGTIINLTETTAIQTQTDYINICNDAFLKVKQGRNLKDVIDEAVQASANCGAWIMYPSGHKDRANVAIARAVRTGINQANGDMVLTKCAQVGANYVRISSHYGARDTKKHNYTNHSWWQGQVYHLDWKNDASLERYGGANVQDDGNPKHYKDFSLLGYRKIEGLCGINCRHYIMMFFPEMQNDAPEKVNKKAQDKRVELEKKQRAMERTIRRQKRLYVANMSAYGKTAQQAKDAKKRLDALMARYDNFCRKNKLPRREWALDK